jgi:Fe-S cluster assembly protein SufD
MTDIKQHLISLYRDNTDVLSEGSVDILNKPREKALVDFDRLGIPTTKHESYRYTPLDKYFDGYFDVELRANPFLVDLHEIFKCDVPELDTLVVLLLNGFYYGVSRESALPEGVVVCGLNEAAARYPDKVLDHYGRYADTAADGLVALNTLFSQDGVFVYVPA